MNRPSHPNHWYNGAVFYSIYPLGAVNHKRENDYVQTTEGMQELARWKDYIAALGCNAVYFAPVFQSQTHGYDTADYRRIDSRLGTNEQFAQLVRDYHAAGIRVVVDGVFNHTGRDFFAFRDILQHRENSCYRNWYRGIDFHAGSPMGDSFAYEAWRGHPELPRLNPHHADTRRYLLDTALFWISEFDIDGIRLDCADCLDFGFLRELRGVCTAAKADFWLMGEVIHGDYNRWANPETLHSVTNYECAKGLYSSHNDGNLHEIAYSLNRQFGSGGIYKQLQLYNFADNHDLNRLADTVKQPEYLPTIYTLLYTMPGIPSVYYGSEWGMRGTTDRVTDWNLRPAVDIANLPPENPALTAHIRALAACRAQSAALRHGSYRQLFVAPQQFAFLREGEGDAAIVAINIADHPARITVESGGAKLIDLLAPGEHFPAVGGEASIALPAHGSRILHPGAAACSDGEQAPAPEHGISASLGSQ